MSSFCERKMQENYVLIDVDCGVDDAWALLMLIRAEMEWKKLKILGISCVNGNTTVDNVVKNVFRLLEAVGRLDIPVYRGCGQSLVAPTFERENYYGIDGFGDIEYDTSIDTSTLQEEHAVNAWYKFVLKYPKKISLILIGPLTNFAVCSTMYSDFNEKLGEIYIMGGNWRGRGNITKSGEFNFYMDPEAAAITFENSKVPIILLPFEPCIEGDFDCMSMEWRKKVFADTTEPEIKLLNRVEEATLFKRAKKNWIECDIYLIAIFLFPDSIIAKSEFHCAAVETSGQHTRGQMVVDYLRQSRENVKIIQELNTQKIKQLILWTAKQLSTEELLKHLKPNQP